MKRDVLVKGELDETSARHARQEKPPRLLPYSKAP